MPRAPSGVPHTTGLVDRRPVGRTGVARDVGVRTDGHTCVVEASGRGVVARLPDRVERGVGVVDGAPVGREAQPVGNRHTVVDQRRTSAGVPVVERPERLTGIVLFVHRPEHESAVAVGRPSLHRVAVSSVSTGCSSHCAGVAIEAGDALRERRHEISFLGDGETATGRRAPARRTTRPLSAGAGGDRGCRSTATRNGPDPRLDTPRDGHHSRRRPRLSFAAPPSAHLPWFPSAHHRAGRDRPVPTS